jgi:RNA polymerase sigma-70 factor, ECF subfamily
MEFEGDRDTVRRRDQGLQLALNGDQEALGRLLASYMPQLYRVALRVLDTPQDAEDALQDGLLQVVQHFREFEGRSRLSTWLTRIVINAALMRLRRSRPEVTTKIDPKLDQDVLCLADTIADPGPTPEEMYAREERLQILKRMLRSLPAAYASALWLRDFQGMSTKEVAEAMGVPEGSVKSHVHRARLRLRNKMGAAQGTHKTPLLQQGGVAVGRTVRHIASRWRQTAPQPLGKAMKPIRQEG